MTKTIERNEIVEGVIWKQLLLFFFPILIGSFFQQLYNTVDTIIVGQYVGKEALAGVGATGNVINLWLGFFIGLAGGASVIISHFYGARDDDSLSKAVHTSMALSIAGGIVIMLIGLATAKVSLEILDVAEEVMDEAMTYIIVFYCGMVATVIYNVGTGILRAVGDSKRPLYILIACCVVNIVLDLLFVVAFHWDVFGVALATVLSQVVSAVLIMAILMRTHEGYRVELKKIRFHGSMLRRIMRLGLPTGMQSVLYTISNLVIQAAVNAFGTDAMASWSAISRVDGFVWMIMGAFGISVTTFVGQNYGAGRYDRVLRGTRVCLAMTAGTILVLSVAEIVFAGPILRIFTGDEAVVSLGTTFVRVWAPAYVAYVFIEIYSGAARGVGEALPPMIITIFGVCVLRLIWIWAVLPFHRTPAMVAASYPVTWGITAAVFIVYYLRMNWLKRHLPPGAVLPTRRAGRPGSVPDAVGERSEL